MGERSSIGRRARGVGTATCALSLVCGLIPAAFAASKPDLVEISVSRPPLSRVQGEAFKITDTVKNKGTAKARSSTTRYYLSKDDRRNAGDKRLTGSRSISSLTPGSSSQGQKKVTIPLSTPGGNYFVLACADDLKNVRESNETNNCKASSRKIEIEVRDTTPPEPPSLVGSIPASPANNNSPQITGQAEPGSTVMLFTEPDCSGPPAPGETGTADALGNFEAGAYVADDSTTTFYAAANDASGNLSACSSSSVTYIEDSTAPAAPTGMASNPAATTSASGRNNNNPKILGSAEAGSTVKLFTTSDCSGDPAASGSASTFTSPGISVNVEDNTATTFKATATDAAGNVSPCSSTSVTYHEDSTAPNAPAITLSSPSTTSSTPTKNTAPFLSGPGEPNSLVRIYTNSTCTTFVAQTPASSSGGWSVQVGAQRDGTTTYYATATDFAGNVSACSSPAFNYYTDNTSPFPPSIFGFSPASPNSDPTPEIYGAAEAGSTVRIYLGTCGGTQVGSGSAAAFGGGGITINAASGTNTYFVSATDFAGNQSSCSSATYTRL